MHEQVTPALFAITASRGRWQAAPHLLMLSDKLTQVAAGSLKRLMVFMPPRSGKSQLCSQFFPAWYLGHHPDNRIILTSYEADFAATWGWKVRTVFEEFAPEIFGLSQSPTRTKNCQYCGNAKPKKSEGALCRAVHHKSHTTPYPELGRSRRRHEYGRSRRGNYGQGRKFDNYR